MLAPQYEDALCSCGHDLAEHDGYDGAHWPCQTFLCACVAYDPEPQELDTPRDSV